MKKAISSILTIITVYLVLILHQAFLKSEVDSIDFLVLYILDVLFLVIPLFKQYEPYFFKLLTPKQPKND